MTSTLHRNWEPVAPETTGKFYFSGTITLLGRIGLSFEPHSIKIDVVKKEADRLVAIFRGEEIELTDFKGEWLGPEPEGEVWQ